MPIIDFDYTDNLKIDKKIKCFLLETHHILVKEIQTDLKTCRSTITKRNNYIINDGDPNNAFIILRIQMLPGRNDEIKHRVGEILLEKIKQVFFEEIYKLDTQVRVYLTETDKKYYYGF